MAASNIYGSSHRWQPAPSRDFRALGIAFEFWIYEKCGSLFVQNEEKPQNADRVRKPNFIISPRTAARTTARVVHGAAVRRRFLMTSTRTMRT